MNPSTFDMEEFMKQEEPVQAPAETETAEEEEAKEEETAPELDVQKAVVESLATDKAELSSEVESLKAEIESLKAKISSLTSELAAEREKEIDVQERNPNALALLDREIELPDRFPGETRDHVLEVIKEARDAAEAEGRQRKAQVLEAVLLANEPNGQLAKRRAEMEKIFAENANVINGTVLSELKKRKISHKNGEDYLLPSEIIKRNY